MITVAHGADSETADMTGRPVREVRAAYENVFNIPRNAIAKVNNQETSEDYVLKEGDKVVFDKPHDKFVN